VLGLLLVALLPLEQARCVCAPLGPRSARAASPAPACAKSCCATHASARGDRPSSPAQRSDCPCARLSAPEPPSALAVTDAGPQVPHFAAIAVPETIEPAPATPETPPALDIGSPPHPVDPGAHGLRAPPRSA
jgi:hypothetical protein